MLTRVILTFLVLELYSREKWQIATQNTLAIPSERLRPIDIPVLRDLTKGKDRVF